MPRPRKRIRANGKAANEQNSRLATTLNTLTTVLFSK